MLKRLMRSEAFLSAAGALAASYIRLVYRTSRIIREPADVYDRAGADAPVIAAMWHGQFLMIPALVENRLDFKCMVARHGDAEIVGHALGRFGLGLIRGAGAGMRKRDRGGAHALRAALKTLSEGANVAMTAEVPPGPARQAGLGIVTLARMSGRPVMPAAIATSRFLTLNSWSRFTVNLPFSKLALVTGEKVMVPRDASEEELETARQRIETALNETTRRAYELVGRDMAETLPVGAGGSVAPGFSFRAYRAISRAIHPVAGIFLRRRSQQGKELPERLNERMGVASQPRPAGTLLWLHAASVGETNVVLPLIEALRRERPELGILLTTVTVTSARIAASRLPKGAVHQFIPLDTPAFVKRFLDHWRPNMALFVESEIWPNLIMDADRRRIPLFLLNARMSDRSFRRWLKLRGLSRPIFSRFAMVLAQSDVLARRLVKLGARKVIPAGNLKFDSPPPPIDRLELSRMKAQTAGRRIFLAASTHQGEDEMIAEAHKMLSAQYPGLLTVIVPRHPERGPLIAEQLKTSNPDLRKLITLKPGDAQAYNALGYSLADRNVRLPEARDLIRKALSMSPGEPFITDSLGWVEYRMGNREEALKWLRQAYAARPDTEIAAHLGEVLDPAGDDRERVLAARGACELLVEAGVPNSRRSGARSPRRSCGASRWRRGRRRSRARARRSSRSARTPGGRHR
ncbi:MAG: DUF374 domain-containing protein [Rhodomicrobium sp.]|nr:DUF374 domain-containing protein [Rhodomicrobium sp.]